LEWTLEARLEAAYMSDAMGEMLKSYDCNHVGLGRDLGKIVAFSAQS